MLSLSKLAEENRTAVNGFPPGFPSPSADLSHLASLYAGNNLGNGLLSAAYGFPSLFSRFYPPNAFLGNSGASNASATNSADESVSRLAGLGTMPSWPSSQSFLPPPQGLSPSMSNSSATPPTSSSGNVSNPMLNTFGSSNASFPFFPPFGIHPFDFSRLPSTVNSDNFDLKNFDPRAMLSAYFGAFGNSSAPIDSASVPNPMLHPFGSSSSPLIGASGPVANSTAASMANTTHSTPTTSSSSNSSVSSSSKLNSPVMSTHESKFSPLSLSSLNEQLEQGRDLLQLHESLNQRFKASSNLSSITSNSAFGNRFFPYGIRPFLYNGQQNASAKLSSPNETDDKLLSPKSDSDDLCDKKLRLNSGPSSDCGSPSRSHSSGHQSGVDSDCSSPRTNESQPSSPAHFEEKSDKQSKTKNGNKESIQELKSMQRMVEGLEASRANTTAPTIAAT